MGKRFQMDRPRPEPMSCQLFITTREYLREADFTKAKGLFSLWFWRFKFKIRWFHWFLVWPLMRAAEGRAHTDDHMVRDWALCTSQLTLPKNAFQVHAPSDLETSH